MTRHDPTSRPAADRPARAALALGLVALALVGATAAGAAATQSADPAVRVGGGTTVPDGTVTVGVVLTAAPDGLSGYYLDVSVANPDVARVESASYPDRFGITTDPAVGDDGATVTLEAADVEGAIESGASTVTLATLKVRGVAPGGTELAVEPRQFDADDGSEFDPATRAGVVTVTGDGGGATGTGAATADAAATGAGADAADASTPTAAATTAAGPLPAALVVVALAAVAALALRRP